MNNKVKVVVNVEPGRSAGIVKYITKKGVSDFKRTPTQITFKTDRKQAVDLLIDLKYRFPITYVSGWIS